MATNSGLARKSRSIVSGVLLLALLGVGSYYYWARTSAPSIDIFPTTPGTRWVYESYAFEDGEDVTMVRTEELLEVNQNRTAMLAIRETSGDSLPVYMFYDVGKRTVTQVGWSMGEPPLEHYSRLAEPADSPRRIAIGSTWKEGSTELRALRWASVETRAGTFPKALVVEATDECDGYIYYYVDGIGLVKDTMNGITLVELVEFRPGK